ncbi:MAG TPA: hypothetical protein VJZ32_06340 [Candidatus Bathyarchaeia archaeon]|nr:hypothetical protein [Candidatus Bathyarchaeia archaeon]
MSLTLLIVMGIMHPVAATGQYNVKLDSCGSNQYWYNPTSTAPEGFNEPFTVSNLDDQSYQIGLGFTVTHMQSGLQINDTADDTVVTLMPDQTSDVLSRIFVFPQNAPEGWYSVTCSIWLGQPGSGTWLDSVTKTHAIYVGSSDPTTFSYGYLGDTAFTPGKIAFDNSGNLGVTDTGNGNFLMFSPPFDTRGLALSGMVTLKTYNGGTGAAWTFDSCGNVWVVDTTSSQILEFTPPFREGVNASLSIEVPILNYTSYVTTPSDLAFDSSGNLWVVDHHGSRVLEFNHPFSNGMNPSIVIGQSDFTSTGESLTQNGFSSSSALMFDTSGNLWVVDSGDDQSQAGRVLEFSPPFSNGMNAAVVIGASNFTSPGDLGATCMIAYCGPNYLMFDSSGNLWVDNSAFFDVWRFSRPFSSGMNASLFWQSPGCADCTGPTGLASDSSGNLWMGNQAYAGGEMLTGGLLMFNPNHISTLPVSNSIANYVPSTDFAPYYNATQNAFSNAQAQSGQASNCQSESTGFNSQLESGANYTNYLIVGIVMVVIAAAILSIRKRKR